MILPPILRMLGIIQVDTDESSDVITVSGLPMDLIGRDMKKLWNTNRIRNNLFIKYTNSSVSFHSFFALEFVSALNIIIESNPTYTKRAVLKEIVSKMSESTWVGNPKKDPILDRSVLKGMRRTPQPSQSEFFDEYEESVSKMGLTGYYLGSPMGGGKTTSALMLGEMLHADTVIVLCPTTAVDVTWVSEIELTFRRQQKIWTSTGNTALSKSYKYYISHYEGLKKLLVNTNIFRGRRVAIFLDESHKFNELSSGRTNDFIKLVHEVNSICTLWISGTQFKAIASEMIPFLKTCDPLFTDAVEAQFKGIFGVSVPRANDILARRIGKVTFTVPTSSIIKKPIIEEELWVKIKNGDKYTLDSVRKDMSQFINTRMQYYTGNRSGYIEIYNTAINTIRDKLESDYALDYARYIDDVDVLMNTSDYRPYGTVMANTNKFESEVIIPLLSNDNKKLFKKAKGVAKYPELVVRGEALGRVVGRLRIDCFREIAKVVDYDSIIATSEKKVVIFTSNVDVLRIVNDILSKKYSPLTVYGDNTKYIAETMRKFRKSVDHNVLIATFDSLSESVRVNEASTVILLNSPYRDYIKRQAMARLTSIKQDTQPYAISVFLDTGEVPNLSTRSKDLLDWSKEQVSTLMSKTTDVSIESYQDLATFANTHIPGFYKPEGIPTSAYWNRIE